MEENVGEGEEVDDDGAALDGCLMPLGVEMYEGFVPGEDGFVKKMRRRFRERRYMEENVGEDEQVDEDRGEDEDKEAALGSSVGWKEKWIRRLSFALA
ncbi:hypothetical protein CYMTET_52361 [Cymbomonas tetramitiformis]|uniref:Uncharacterized protein n=1 Tax=Cymbomonas tetramitiformis TaxID=36881 RepID=A0AAE0ERQ5_9CHLO|nr:hypothetical protein CYMTET_52361 [Cymbomonas tetramitiformis]